MGIASMLASMAHWSTPTLLFCLLNLMIAIIFITSNFKSPNHHNNIPSQLSPRVSLLQRVKSIDFSFSSFHNSFPTEPELLNNSPTEQTQSLSLMDRVKSFKLTSPFDYDQHSGQTISSSKDEHSQMDSRHDSVEDKKLQANRLEKCSMSPVNRSPSKLTKSGSKKKAAASEDGEENVDRQPPAKLKATIGVHDGSVDAKADDFIQRFKHQLKLQRLDSLQRWREMLNRGT